MAEVADPVAASQGVADLPKIAEPVEAPAASTPIHSVTGAIMRRGTRLVNLFDDNESALDALLDVLTGLNNFMVVSRTKAEDVGEIEVSSIMALDGGEARIVMTIRRR